MATFTISTSAELDSFMRGALGTPSDTFFIAADIDMTGFFYANGPFYSGLTGIFDGGGHIISSLRIEGSNDFTGVFPQLFGRLQNITFRDISITNHSVNTNTGTGVIGFLGPGGVVLDVNATGLSVVSASCQRVGAIAGNVFGGQFEGTIQVGSATERPTVTGSQNNVGGLVGFWGDGPLNCVAINYATVSMASAAAFAGGIAGAIQSTPFTNNTRLINHGFISGTEYVGGLFGNYSVAQTVVFDGSESLPANAIAFISDGPIGVSPVSSLSGMIFGGVFGNLAGAGATLQNYTHTAPVIGISYVGGILGNLSGDCTVQNVTNAAAVDALSPELAVLGGVVGHVTNGALRDATNIAPINVTGGGANVGGIVGQVNSNGTAVLTGTFANGAPGTSATIRTASTNTGGILGFINNGTTVAFDAYNYMDIITAPGTGLVGGIIGVIYGEGASRPNILFTGNQLLRNEGQVTGGGFVGGIFGWLTDNAIPGSIAPLEFLGGSVKQPGIVTIHNEGVIHSSTGSVGRFGGVMGALDAQNAILRDYTNTVSVAGTHMVGGLIGSLTAGTLMDNLRNEGGLSITGDGNDIGGLIGMMSGGVLAEATIFNSMNVSGSAASEFVGCVIGRALPNAVIQPDVSLINEGSVSGGSSVGGIIGVLTTNQEIIFDGTGGPDTVHIINQGTVLPASGATGGFFGGIFGAMDAANATLRSIFYNHNVTGYRYVGALIGRLGSGTVSDSFNKGAVTANSEAGGIVGLLDTGGTILRCYNTGTVLATDGVAGGVIGEQHGFAQDCYNLGTVSGLRAGGFVDTAVSGAQIINAYNAGLVTGALPSAFVSSPGGATLENTYYDSTTTQATDQPASPLTTEQLITRLPNGFATSGAWLSGRDGEPTYPYLAWQLDSGRDNGYDRQHQRLICLQYLRRELCPAAARNIHCDRNDNQAESAHIGGCDERK